MTLFGSAKKKILNKKDSEQYKINKEDEEGLYTTKINILHIKFEINKFIFY